jgi:uncharacterized membrane protein
MAVGDYTHSVDVDCPIRTVYNQWTQFEEFPHFMEGVRSVRQVDDTHLVWDVEIAGVEREFNATITEQHPDMRVAWTTTDGPYQAGVVTFHRIDDMTTRVTLQMDYEPEGFVENVGDKLGFVRGRIEGDLRRFKDFIEDRQRETGSWRGDVEGGQVKGGNQGDNIDLTGDRTRTGATGLGGTTGGTTGTTGMGGTGTTDRPGL